MDDYRNSPTGTGVLGEVFAGSQITGILEEPGDADAFRTVLIAGLDYQIAVVGIGPDPLGEAFLEQLDKNFGYLGFAEVPDDFSFTPELTGFHYFTIYDPSFGEPGHDITGGYRLSISAGLGSAGADTITGTKYGDAVNAAGGNDFVNGAEGEDSLSGGTGNDTVLGGGFHDELFGEAGADLLRGQGGNDTLTGGDGADVLIGGAGLDAFAFRSAGQSAPGTRDTIRAGDGAPAFQPGDEIDLSGIDANTVQGGNQAFVYGGVIGQAASGARGFVYAVTVGQDTVIRGNVDNDAAWEVEIEIEDGARAASAYGAGDFIL